LSPSGLRPDAKPRQIKKVEGIIATSPGDR